MTAENNNNTVRVMIDYFQSFVENNIGQLTPVCMQPKVSCEQLVRVLVPGSASCNRLGLRRYCKQLRLDSWVVIV